MRRIHLQEKFRLLPTRWRISIRAKVIEAFRKNRDRAPPLFGPSTGYGYSDEGRDTRWAHCLLIYSAPRRALVSPNIGFGHARADGRPVRPSARGRHALFHIGRSLRYAAGSHLGQRDTGSLADYGIKFKKCRADRRRISIFTPSPNGLRRSGSESCFYSALARLCVERCAQSQEKIAERVRLSCERARLSTAAYSWTIATANSSKQTEPTQNGADIAVGSLIKNAGGGIAPTGGYIVGKREYVDRIAGRLTAPSVGAEVGSYAFGYQYFYEGVFSGAAYRLPKR